MMKSKVYLLFDACDTLCYLDYERLSNFLKRHKIEAEIEKLMRRAFEVNYKIDMYLKEGRKLWQGDFIRGYFREYLKTLTINEDEVNNLIDGIAAEDKKLSLWSSTFDGVKNTLSILKARGYHMSVISNSDGRVSDILKKIGLNEFMEKIYDSYVVGMEKPNPRIFDMAISDLNLSRSRTLFIGDLFYLDVLGANKSGIPAVHIDHCDLYKGWPGVRINNVAELPDLLETLDLSSPDLFPFKNQRI